MSSIHQQHEQHFEFNPILEVLEGEIRQTKLNLSVAANTLGRKDCKRRIVETNQLRENRNGIRSVTH